MCDGHIVYQGIANQAPAYFNELGYSIKGYCNPADEFMKFLSINYPKRNSDELKIEKFVS